MSEDPEVLRLTPAEVEQLEDALTPPEETYEQACERIERARLADAWDEGYVAGTYRGGGDNDGPPHVPNPYRKSNDR